MMSGDLPLAQILIISHLGFFIMLLIIQIRLQWQVSEYMFNDLSRTLLMISRFIIESAIGEYMSTGNDLSSLNY